MSAYTFLQLLLTAVTLGYSLFLLWLARAVLALRSKPLSHVNNQHKPVSIVIPFLNDEEHAPALLYSLAQLRYPEHLMEIILVNDYSHPAALLQWQKCLQEYPQLPIQIIKNTGEAGKKNALRAGIEAAHNDLVLQTDADACPQPQWVAAFVQAMAGNSPLILGLVVMQPSSFWGRLAALDFMSLQASGLALAHLQKPIMANGASLAFNRAIWLQSPFNSREPASGDDTFMVQRLARYYPVSYALKARVATPAPVHYSDFIKQRLRWGAKSVAYPAPFGKWVALLVALGNFAAVMAVVAAVFVFISWQNLAVIWLVKILAEATVLIAFARKTRQIRLLRLLPLSLLVYPFYTVHILMLIIFYKQSQWKGRDIALRGRS